MKKGLIYIALLFSMHLQGQVSLQKDTILIKEVEIMGKNSLHKHTGFKITRLDSSIISHYNQLTLADLVSDNSGIYIKTYGSAGLATPSIRGTGSGHTQITWNNINLNNPMVGQFDMSLVPAGLIDNVNIFYGGGSMSINSGGFGGIIDLETKPDWNDQNILSLNPGIGSFGSYSGLVKIKAGTADFQSVTKAFIKNADNDFSYLNNVSGPEPYWETRKNNQIRQKGFIQELYYKNSNSTYSGRFWYQSASRYLPVPIIVQTMNPPEKQDDESLRAMVTYETSKGSTDLNITAAFISDKLDYLNKLASVDSRNISKRYLLKSDFETRINDIMDLGLAFNNEFNIVNTNNYTDKKTRNVASVDATTQLNLNRWMIARILIRETLQDNTLLLPDFSASTDIKPFREKYYFIKASFSKNSKIPSLNDMYWSPGGNPDLKNENGYLSEIVMEVTNILSNILRIKNDLTIFRNHLSNIIQWHPGEFSYWEADNINNLMTSGLEAGLEINLSVSRFNARLNAGYTYTKATIEDLDDSDSLASGKQLAYIPTNQLNALLKLDWRFLYSSFNSAYMGKRFLTADNSQYLPPYLVSDLSIGFRFSTGQTSYNAGFIIENIFNVSYQNMAYYPMPGRNFLLTIIFQLKK